SKSIPLALTSGRDLLVRARTGSGKTLAYCIPVVQKILGRKSLLAERGEEEEEEEENDAEGVGGGTAVKGVILVPTRELCSQVSQVLDDLTYYCADQIKVVVLSSSATSTKKGKRKKKAGESSGDTLQQEALLRDRPDIVVATPAGLVTHVRSGKLNLKRSVETLVVDEADLILSFGYANNVTEIMKSLPKTCQGFLMSATLSPELHKLKHVVLHSPAVLKLEGEDDDDPATQQNGSEGSLLQFHLTLQNTRDKYLVLYVFLKLGLLKGKGLFFVNTIDGGYRLKLFLEQFHIRSAVLNSELPLKSRLNIIEHFNVGNFDYLIATDEATHRRSRHDDEHDDGIDGEGDKKRNHNKQQKQRSNKRKGDGEYGVSRGLDFRNVSFVVNVDLPTSPDSYTHRIGRTARGGANGVALTLVDGSKREEGEMLAMIQESQPVKKQQLGGGGGDGDGELKEVTETEGGGGGGEVQPCPLDFDLREIEGFRYRVEDVSRAVTRVAIRETRASEVKAEILNSERLQSHFAQNPADLQLLQHDRRSTHISKVQDHLKHVPTYMLPRGMEVDENVSRKRRKKKTRSQKKKIAAAASGSGRERNKANDPLQNFDGDVTMDGLLVDNNNDDDSGGGNDDLEEEDKFFDEMDNDDDGDDDEDEKEAKNRAILDMPNNDGGGGGGDYDGYGKSTAGRNAWKQKHNKGKFNRKLQREKHEQLHKW
ncbi:hypothetical protein ACHAXR_004166, partial [Thalassiosira sp. AJA248-18]